MSSVAPGTPNPVGRRTSDLGFGEAFTVAATITGVVERDYVIAGHGVRMRFAGPAMLDRLTGSFSHLAAAVGEPELVINVWDSASSGTPSPGIEGTEVEGDGTGPILYYEEQGVRAITRWNTVSVLDGVANEAWFWAPDPAVMLSWDWASPMRAILHWWLGGMGILQVHGGAVGTDDGGVIIVGRGGSGKSTTSLACLTAGLQYAGDDFVAIETRPEPRVHSLYSSGKLESHQIERFPELVSAVVNPVREEEEKAIIYADRRVPRVTVPGFPLRAVLVPRIAGVRDTGVVPTSGIAALAALAPSTIFQLHPPQENALAEMAELVRRVPCYSLELGTDLTQIPGAIAGLLREL